MDNTINKKFAAAILTNKSVLPREDGVRCHKSRGRIPYANRFEEPALGMCLWLGVMVGTRRVQSVLDRPKLIDKSKLVIDK